MGYSAADLVDPSRERWRFADRDDGIARHPYVRDQGQLLVEGTDYTVLDNSVIALVNEAGEPVTVKPDKTFQGAGVVQALLARAGLSAFDERYRALFTASMGLVGRRQDLASAIREVLQGCGGYLTLRPSGALELGALVPPSSPGPRGGKVMEIVGYLAPDSTTALHPAGLDWSGLSQLWTGDAFCLGGWVKTHRLGASDPDLFATKSDVLVLQVATATGGDALTLSIAREPGSASSFVRLARWSTSGSIIDEIRAPIGFAEFLVASEEWWYFAVVANLATPSTTFYAGQRGGTLKTLASTSEVPGYSVPADWTTACVGSAQLGAAELVPFFGAVAEPQVWNGEPSYAELHAALVATPDPGTATTPISFLALLDGEDGLDELVNGISPTATGLVVERPDLEIHLDEAPRPYSERRITPARSITVRFNRNLDQLSASDFAPGLSAAERQEQERESEVLRWTSPDVEADYKTAKDVVYDSYWVDALGAEITMRQARYRYTPGRRVAVLGNFPQAPLREGLGLNLGDEVRVYGVGRLADGPAHRLIGSRKNFDSLDCELSLWR